MFAICMFLAGIVVVLFTIAFNLRRIADALEAIDKRMERDERRGEEPLPVIGHDKQ